MPDFNPALRPKPYVGSGLFAGAVSAADLKEIGTYKYLSKSAGAMALVSAREGRIDWMFQHVRSSILLFHCLDLTPPTYVRVY